MKLLNRPMIWIMAIAAWCAILTTTQLNAHAADTRNEVKKWPQVQTALLLDTSNSMDGLIEQAKS